MTESFGPLGPTNPPESPKQPDGSIRQNETETERVLREVLAERAALAEDVPARRWPTPDGRHPNRTGPNLGFKLAAVAAAVAIIVGGIAVIAVRQRAASEVATGSPADVLSSLRASGGGARAANTFSFTADETTTVTPPNGGPPDCSSSSQMSGRMDPARNLFQVDRDGSTLVGDRNDLSVVVSANALPPSWRGDGDWVKFSARQAVMAGRTMEPTNLITTAHVGLPSPNWDTGDIVHQLDDLKAAATTADIVGEEVVRGVATRHARVQVDQATLTKGKPPLERSLQALHDAGILDSTQSPAGPPTPQSQMLAGLMTPAETLTIDTWIDQDGTLRRITSTTTTTVPLLAGMSSPLAGMSSTTTTSSIFELFGYDESPIAAPAEGERVIDAGQLPASTLKRIQPTERPCGQSPSPSPSPCAESAFTNQTAGKTVDQYLATVPKTFLTLIDPDAEFPACKPFFGPLPDGSTILGQPTPEQIFAATGVDPARRQGFVTATETVAALAQLDSTKRLFGGSLICSEIRRTANRAEIDRELTSPSALSLGVTRDGPHALLMAATDRTTGLCPEFAR